MSSAKGGLYIGRCEATDTFICCLARRLEHPPKLYPRLSREESAAVNVG